MEVVIVAAHRIGIRTLQATGILLAAVMFSGCGQPANESGQPAPPPAEGESSLTQTNGGNTPGAGATENTPPASDPAAEQATDTTEDTQAPASESPSAAAQGASATDGRCHTSMLSGALERGDSGAGQRYAELVLTNQSAETCTLYGYGGFQLVDSNGQAVLTQLSREPNPGPVAIELAPGEAASKTLHWTVVPYEGEPSDAPCQQEASGALVIPPDETDPLRVDWNFGPVCGFGSIDGSAYHQ